MREKNVFSLPLPLLQPTQRLGNLSSQADKTPEAIVLLHGLFMKGWDMAVLRHRLKTAGFIPYQFVYPSVSLSPLENARHLNEFIQRIDVPIIHYVGHSLGGIILRHYFHNYPHNRPGRIVTLGTPHLGSSVAKHMAQREYWRNFLGRSIDQGLLGDIPPWDSDYELGSIAGYYSAGMGRFFLRFDEPNDGTVTVRETELPNATDHISLPINHSGMVFSANVTAQVVRFLKTGKFEH
jgi:pimeloyl-ACP methyl ester carboxylesterase